MIPDSGLLFLGHPVYQMCIGKRRSNFASAPIMQANCILSHPLYRYMEIIA